MADYKTQIENLTGLTTSTGLPSDGAITQFLRDCVIDVTNRCIAIKPDEALDFTRESAEQTANEALDLNGAQIISVVRESGTNNDWRNCKFIPVHLQSRVTDEKSLSYSSKFNPSYTINNNGKISVFPVAASGGANSYKVYYINNDPLDNDDNNLAYNSNSIKYFPADKEYMVVLLASTRCLMKAMGSQTLPADIADPVLGETSRSLSTSLITSIDYQSVVPPADIDVDFSGIEEIDTFISPIMEIPTLDSLGALRLPADLVPATSTAVTVPSTSVALRPTYTVPVLSLDPAPNITDLSISAIAPVCGSLSTNTVSISSMVDPNYVAPMLTSVDITIADLSISSVPPTPPAIDLSSVSITGTAPTFVPPVMDAPNWSDTNNWITTEEDPEMLVARIQEIGGKINEYSARMAESQAKFNKENVEYQALLQKDIKDAELKDSKKAQELQKHRNDIDVYQANVAKEVQEWQSNMQKDYQIWEKKTSNNLQEYSFNIQNNLNTFNKENAILQKELSIAIRNLDAADAEDRRVLEKYAADTVLYKDNINKEVQDWQSNTQKEIELWQNKVSFDLQKYQADIQNQLNKFNKELRIYEIATNRDFKQADLDNENKSREIALFSSNIQKYSAEVNSAIQEWQSTEFTPKFTEWTEKFEKRIAKYGQDISKEQAKFSASLSTYQAKVEKALQKYQAETGRDMAEYQAKIQAVSQEFESKIGQFVQDSRLDLDKYTAEFQKVSSDNQNIIGKFSTEVQNYANKLNKERLNYEWLQGRYMALKQEYDDAFLLMGGPRKQQGER